ncbi:hypothetical protein BC834DRAFT_885653 [Gloeopeniophorella convolvens]|nr:hypothetical protein BC834DRAFT_885653 [Gloeopeniophorella convolvens]
MLIVARTLQLQLPSYSFRHRLPLRPVHSRATHCIRILSHPNYPFKANHHALLYCPRCHPCCIRSTPCIRCSFLVSFEYLDRFIQAPNSSSEPRRLKANAHKRISFSDILHDGENVVKEAAPVAEDLLPLASLFLKRGVSLDSVLSEVGPFIDAIKSGNFGGAISDVKTAFNSRGDLEERQESPSELIPIAKGLAGLITSFAATAGIEKLFGDKSSRDVQLEQIAALARRAINELD